ncbi:MAG: PKD domain-containing protein [Candidatus Peribacteraceae bacterium]
MNDPQTPNVSVDGLSPALPSTSETQVPSLPPAPPRDKAHERRTVVIMIILAAIYTLPALVLISLFPRTDGALTGLKSAATLIYAVCGVLWLLLGAAGFLRIGSLKDRPRMRFFAGIRLAVLVIPMLILSGLVPVLINIAPALRLEIASPRTAAEMVAPVAVQFGMPTALRYFSTLGLTPLNYQWDYNNDGKSDQETFDPVSTYVISRAGIYNIVCTVSMTDGSRKNVVLRLVISRASFGVQPSTPVIDEPVTFSLDHLFPKTSANATTPTLTKAEWDFDNDGTVDTESTGLTATSMFHTLGEREVAVRVTLSNQTQQTLTRTVTVVEPTPQPFPVALETEPGLLLGPPPFPVLFSIKTDEKVASASWDFGDQKTAEGLRVAHQFAAIGNFTVSATVRSASGTIAKLTKLVRVTEPLEIRDLTLQGSPPVKNFEIEGPVPLTVDLTPNTLQTFITFSWDVPNASDFTVTGKSLRAVYRDEGRYTIDLIGVDPDGRVFRKPIVIQAKSPASSVVFTMTPVAPTAPASVSFDASDTFVPSGEQVTGFEWKFGDQASVAARFTGARTDYRYEKPGTYVIELTVRTINGNSYTGKQTLVVRASLVDACVLPSRTKGAAPLGVKFDTSCSTGDFTSWKWNFGDGSESDQASPVHVFTEAGEYTVRATATTADGKASTITTTISVSS